MLPAEMLDHLPLERVTVVERLQKAGYATGFFDDASVESKELGTMWVRRRTCRRSSPKLPPH